MTHTTLEKLKLKAQDSSARMPSIKSISKMLNDFGIKHYCSESTNVVENRSAGNRYVNSRYDGKVGSCLVIKEEGVHIELDSSSSYYSWNTYGYAREIVNFLSKKSLV